MTPRTLLPASPAWVSIPEIRDGSGYAYAVGQDAGLIVCPVAPTARGLGPISEGGKTLFDQPTVRGWWADKARYRALPGFHAVPLLPVYLDPRTLLAGRWPRRFAGVLWYRSLMEFGGAVREMRVWADRVAEIESIVLLLKGVPLEQVRGALDDALDSRFRVLT